MAHKTNQETNLRVPTSEEARKNGRAGGIASARKRQERRQLRDTLEYLMKMPVESGPSYSITGAESLKDAKLKNAPSGEVIGLSLMSRALKGDLKAIELIQEIMGERSVVVVSPLESLAAKLDDYVEDDDRWRSCCTRTGSAGRRPCGASPTPAT